MQRKIYVYHPQNTKQSKRLANLKHLVRRVKFSNAKKNARRESGLKCKKHEWKLSKVGACSKDGEKKGYYLGTCGGRPIKASSMKKACAVKAAKGNTVVYCKKWKREKKEKRAHPPKITTVINMKQKFSSPNVEERLQLVKMENQSKET